MRGRRRRRAGGCGDEAHAGGEGDRNGRRKRRGERGGRQRGELTRGHAPQTHSPRSRSFRVKIRVAMSLHRKIKYKKPHS
eukprot:834652-Rhodomonas_salina.1